MEIINIGTDIEEVKRIARLNAGTLERVFTREELAYAREKANPPQHLAARFAAKEAVFKTLPFEGIALKKIEIIKEEGQKPRVEVKDKRAAKINFKLSLSHTKDYACAVVLAYKK